MVQAEGDINYNMCDFMVACHCSSLRAVSEPARCTYPAASRSDGWLIVVINRCYVKYFLPCEAESHI